MKASRRRQVPKLSVQYLDASVCLSAAMKLHGLDEECRDGTVTVSMPTGVGGLLCVLNNLM
jgi:hypothetical protein